MNMPRAGTCAKACTEVSTPERTRKVPSSDSEKASSASSTVQLFSASRFSTTMAECSSACRPAMASARRFSTGSQNQKPPQPRM